MTIPAADSPPADRIARRLTLSGCVQGLGVRPAIARLAAECGVCGVVSNQLEGVRIDVEGSAAQVARFERQLPARLPRGAQLERMASVASPVTGANGFRIAESGASGLVRTQVPRDLAVCDPCLADVADHTNRRHDYPFTSCTNCGPRLSIITAMPYDRSRTEMDGFPLCPACRAEFANPADGRFHAQTNACPECGPHVWCGDRAGRVVSQRTRAIDDAARSILQGRIVALRGLGGYQLVCDATQEPAVARLRTLKRRPAKPLAVMVAVIDQATRLATMDEPSRAALSSPANPIVLLTPRPGNGLAPSIHPGLDTVGVMRPTTPLHWLLLRACARPLVVTSGNLEGDPLETNVDAAASRLGGVADLFLHHDRPIAQPLDDSVVRTIAGRVVTLRLARGLAPLPLPLRPPLHAVAVGGHQKSAVALANGGQAVLGPHVGDLDGVRTRQRFAAHVAQFARLYGTEPEAWIHDLHAEYFTTGWAVEQRGRKIAVQHHHAHVVAAMVEHEWLDRELLGVAFDGTGYGSDGTIWGGELLRATATGFRRVGHLREFRLAGGEAAIREPWRVAVALVQQAVGTDELARLWNDDSPHHATPFAERTAPSVTRLLRLLERDRLSPRTTSVGRLFDGVASLVLGVGQVAFEGQAAMLLEAASDPRGAGSYPISVSESDPVQLDWRPMIRELLADRRAGVAPAAMAMRFHRGLAGAVAESCRRFPAVAVALSGGVFQNRLLTELVVEQLADHRQPVGLPGAIPPNDGGLAAGQLAIGLALAERGRKEPPCV